MIIHTKSIYVRAHTHILLLPVGLYACICTLDFLLRFVYVLFHPCPESPESLTHRVPYGRTS